MLQIEQAPCRRSIRLLVIHLLLIGGLASCGTDQQLPSSDPAQQYDYDWDVYKEMLDAGNFNGLEAELDRLTYAYTEGLDNTEVYGRAFYTFQRADPQLEFVLNRWVERSPNAFAPRFARAHYLFGLAYLSRGQATSGETPDESFGRMRDVLVFARRDAELALEIRPDLGAAYAFLMDISLLDRPINESYRLETIGLLKDPRSTLIRSSFLHMLEPRWKGRQAATILTPLVAVIDPYIPMRLYLAKIEADSVDYPWLRSLLGYMEADKAHPIPPNVEFDAAMKHLEKAAEISGESYITLKAQILNSAARHKDVLSLVAEAESKKPGRRWLSKRLKLYEALALYSERQYNSAIAVFDELVETDPYHPVHLYFRGWMENQNHYPDAALLSLKKALILAPSDHDTHLLIGQIYVQKGRAKDAAIYFIEAARLMPYNTDVQYELAETIFQIDFCQAEEPAERFLRLCLFNDCNTPRKDWASATIRLIEQAPVCNQ